MSALPAPISTSIAPHPEPRLEVRDLGSADAHLLEQVHAGLSAQSRYTRYHGHKPRLSPRDLAALAGADGYDHVALIALEDGAAAGVARYIRSNDAPASAEVAAEIVDRLQRQGLGGRLLVHLARRAASAGIERFTATVLSEHGLPAALTRAGWRLRSHDGPTMTLEAEVWTLLSRAASGRVRRLS